MSSLISNPPYNLKWNVPPFAQLQSRFDKCSVPPESNANYAFILTGLEKVDKRAVYIMPCNILERGRHEEKEIRKYLIERNLIDSVILCPEKMFECTDIATCIIVISKEKNDAKITLVDMRKCHESKEREQRGQYGGKSHTNRIYKKKYNVFSQENMDKALDAIQNRRTEKGFCKTVTIKEVEDKEYSLVPTKYIDIDYKEDGHRAYKDIISDINNIIEEKNRLKLTINKSVAESIGLYDVYSMVKESEKLTEGIREELSFIGNVKLEKENFIQISKKKNEIRFENNSKDDISTILLSIMQMWKQHIMYLNTVENRYLKELRDALIPDLITGKIDVSLGKEGKNEH